MSVELVNGHVLFPNRADYSERPKWSRRWENTIVDGVTGAEARQALRAAPRVALSYCVTPENLVATQMLDDRIRAAAKLGQACVPYFGRGAALLADADAGDATVYLHAAWPWQAGDWFFCGDENGSDAQLVSAADLDDGRWTLTLDGVLDFNHAASALAYPLLFGKFTPPDLAALTPRLAPTRLALTELVSARSTPLGAVVPPSGAGVGFLAVATTFAIA